MKHMMDYEKADGCDYFALGAIRETFPANGWRCPRCDIIVAPFMPVCPYCQKKQNIVTDRKTVLMKKDSENE